LVAKSLARSERSFTCVLPTLLAGSLIAAYAPPPIATNSATSDTTMDGVMRRSICSSLERCLRTPSMVDPNPEARLGGIPEPAPQG
jgi:hypothetical protein